MSTGVSGGGAAADELVSIVVPVFNTEAYLRDSLASILSQTYSALEVIVMDDASTDRSAEIAAEIARADERVRVHRQPKNVGIFANANAGLSLAKGDFVGFYHADDLYDAEIVAREVAFLRAHPTAAAVFTLAVLIDSTGREFDRVDRIPPRIGSAELLDYPVLLNAVLEHMWTFLPSPSALVRREIYAEVGEHSLEYGIRSDLDMWLRIARLRPIGLLREPLLHYRVAKHNESRRYGDVRTEPDLFFRVLDERLAAGDRQLAERNSLRAYEAHRAADLLFAAGNAYILGRQARLREILRDIRVSRLLASRHVRRWRLLALFVVLQLLARLPHRTAAARLLRRRWHARPKAKS